MTQRWVAAASERLVSTLKVFPLHCGAWVLLYTAWNGLGAVLDGRLAAMWLLVSTVLSIYFCMVSTWLGLGQGGFRPVGPGLLWRMALGLLGLTYVAVPALVAWMLGGVVSDALRWETITSTSPAVFGAVYWPAGLALAYASARMAYVPYLILDQGDRPGAAILGSLALTRQALVPSLVLAGGPLLLSLAIGVGYAVTGAPPAARAVGDLLTSGTALAGVLGLGGWYRQVRGTAEPGRLADDPFFTVVLALCLACIPMSALVFELGVR